MNATKIEAAKARLQLSRERVEGEQHTAGKAAGTEWAMESAEFDELAKIATLHGQELGDDPAGIVCRNLESRDFWMDWLEPGENVSDAYARGFIEGAAEFHAEHIAA